MLRLRALLSISAVLAFVVPAPAAAAPTRLATTTLSVENITIYYSPPVPRTQMIYVETSASQEVRIAFQPDVPPNLLRGSRQGLDCTRSGTEYVCPGVGDVTLSYGPNKYDDVGYSLEVSTPDGAFALGSVNLMSRTDLEFDPQWTPVHRLRLGHDRYVQRDGPAEAP